ncbi:MAG: hypothetical protein JWM91_1542 [Rhodospirillales bacterium]|nr:hypothetical protein [Rhodospirillales bacterium]
MIDSENSTSLTSVTRRRLLTAAINTAVTPLRIPAPNTTMTGDPILSLWGDWQTAHAEAAAWSEKAGSLEHAMARTMGFPRVLIPSLSQASPIWATSHECIDAELEGVPVTEEQRRQLHSDLVAQQARWDAASESAGLDAADQNEIEAWERSEALASALFALPAQGILGVIIKLTLILRTGEAEVSPEEHPWPQIRSVFDDLRRLAGLDDLMA